MLYKKKFYQKGIIYESHKSFKNVKENKENCFSN